MVQFGEKLSYILPPLVSLELLAAEYRHETNISNFIYHLSMVTCSLDALKKSSMRTKREKVELSQQTIYSRMETGKKKIGKMKFLALTLYLVARITLTLISSPAIIGCFWKDFNLVICSFESSAFSSESCQSFEK